jgi:hypothetical protein
VIPGWTSKGLLYADTMDKLDFEFMAGVVESLVIFFLSHHL